jgi:hypothetical protein
MQNVGAIIFDLLLLAIFLAGVIAAIAAIPVAAYLGDKYRGQQNLGAILGFCCGWFGVPFVFLLADRRRRCVWCEGFLATDSKPCPTCGKWQSVSQNEPPDLRPDAMPEDWQ